MVMNGSQAKSIIFDEDGLAKNMVKGSTVILSATIKPSEAEEIGQLIKDTGIKLIDTPVSGGFPGAQSGTLTLMASAPEDVMSKNRDVLQAISSNIHHVGDGARSRSNGKSLFAIIDRSTIFGNI